MLAVTSSLTSQGSSLLNAFKLSACALSATFANPVRYRYFEDKPRVLQRRWGNTAPDKVELRGLLPRVAGGRALPEPPYVPSNNWCERKALFGQNDYIDILGDDDSIHPGKFAYGVPAWLRGFKGHEYQMLLRKRNAFGAQIRAAYPRTSHLINKRLKYLYRKLNYKTKNFMDRHVMRR